MKRWTVILITIFVLIGATTGAMAASKLTKYACVLDGAQVKLNASTGYLMRSGKTLMVPVAAIADALGLEYTANAKKTRMTITTASATVELAKGYAVARSDGKKVKLGAKTFVSGGKMMAPVKLVTLLGCQYKHVKAGATARAAGYPSGILMVSKEGDNLTLPTMQDNPLTNVDGIGAANQVVLVDYQNGSKATLSFYQKNGQGNWDKTLTSPAYVGKNGIDKVKEGDKKTPTGTFNLTQAFGIKADPGTALPYVQVTKYHYWCGTSGSEYYNRLIDTRVTERARTSADEYLIGYKGVYNYAVFIDYNASGVAGKGSCIFLHCSGSSRSTAGCVSVSQTTMVKLLKALKPGAKIVIR